MQEDILTNMEIKDALEACNKELEKFVLNLLNSKHHKFSKKIILISLMCMKNIKVYAI